MIEAVLGHVGGSRAGVVGVYQRHQFGAETRAALEAWAQEIERIVSGKKADRAPVSHFAAVFSGAGSLTVDVRPIDAVGARRSSRPTRPRASSH